MSFNIRIERTLGDRTVALRIDTRDSLVGLIGPSGAGKTTVLNCLAGLLRPDHGHITIGNMPLFDSDRAIDIVASRRGCGYVFQDSRLFPHLTVLENLTYGSPRIPTQRSLPDFDSVVAMLDIAILLARKPRSLSGGEIRRVAIGRALLSNPAFLLFDEPLVSLDAARGESIMHAIEKLRDATRLPMLYVSHSESEITRLTKTVVRLE